MQTHCFLQHSSTCDLACGAEIAYANGTSAAVILLAGPHEKDNLGDERPDQVKQLREQIDRWWSPVIESDPAQDETNP